MDHIPRGRAVRARVDARSVGFGSLSTLGRRAAAGGVLALVSSGVAAIGLVAHDSRSLSGCAVSGCAVLCRSLILRSADVCADVLCRAVCVRERERGASFVIGLFLASSLLWLRVFLETNLLHTRRGGRFFIAARPAGRVGQGAWRFVSTSWGRWGNQRPTQTHTNACAAWLTEGTSATRLSKPKSRRTAIRSMQPSSETARVRARRSAISW